MALGLRRIFEAERRARARLEEAEERVRQMEAAARGKAEESVRAAEEEGRAIRRRAAEEAQAYAEARRAKLGGELDERERGWRERLARSRDEIVARIVSAVLGGGPPG